MRRYHAPGCAIPGLGLMRTAVRLVVRTCRLQTNVPERVKPRWLCTCNVAIQHVGLAWQDTILRGNAKRDSHQPGDEPAFGLRCT
eukprot:1499269-Pyramimonas_sp.AAC.1